jgi:hypothetical protein
MSTGRDGTIIVVQTQGVTQEDDKSKSKKGIIVIILSFFQSYCLIIYHLYRTSLKNIYYLFWNFVFTIVIIYYLLLTSTDCYKPVWDQIEPLESANRVGLTRQGRCPTQ